MTVLKRWLQCHGLKQSGKKSDLIERVTNSRGIVNVDPDVDGGKWYEIKKNKSQPIDTPENVISPTDTDIWNNFPSHSIPSMFNYGNIVHYIIESVDKIRLPNENQD